MKTSIALRVSLVCCILAIIALLISYYITGHASALYKLSIPLSVLAIFMIIKQQAKKNAK